MSKKDEHANHAKQADHKEPAPQAAEQVAAPMAEAVDPFKKLTAERDDLLSRLQRLSAEFLNYQKRAAREVNEAREYANAELIKSFLSVLDDMERAVEVARNNHSTDDPLLKGMLLVHEKALGLLQQHGLSVIEAAGTQFDPSMHSALLEEATDKHPPKTVLKELQRGYRLKSRILRPAAVVLAKAVPDENPKAE